MAEFAAVETTELRRPDGTLRRSRSIGELDTNGPVKDAPWSPAANQPVSARMAVNRHSRDQLGGCAELVEDSLTVDASVPLGQERDQFVPRLQRTRFGDSAVSAHGSRRAAGVPRASNAITISLHQVGRAAPGPQ
eukprot:NODE_2406_length_1207_cov_24.691710_g2193_i0.p2 GENE.NODE_2406_length_1207_cov_24.691710_g2193_i0~~NODE_2406_length_1207_cov_24.691710_g2193_i0.p2  ORF type:complete len:135 (+),score=4.97 NODE_2406_length_1207_cov_24.691710_g2193_i0:603-1007(+)